MPDSETEYCKYTIKVVVRPKGVKPEYPKGFEDDPIFDKHAFTKILTVYAPTYEDAMFVAEYEIKKTGKYEIIEIL